jgi:HD-GYP domain-containing protein (c-di-GMP phosphodiesterase class II)
MVHRNIHRTVLIRLVLAWLILSLVLGAIVFYLEMKKGDALMLDLALTESGSFTEHLGQDDLTHLALLKQKADDFLKSGFISVRVYDATQSRILEVAKPGGDEARLGIKPDVHSLSPGDLSHHHTYWIGGQPIMQVLLPIAKNGTPLGFVEGVYEVNAETANNIKAGIIRTLTLTVVVILATSIALYPIIIFLNKGLFRLSSALLISNVELMEVLGSAIAKRDADTHVHNYRVTIYAIRLAEALGLSQHNIRRLMTGAFLHDVGKIGIADAILRKPDPLTDEEFRALRMHVALGVDIISKANWLESARDVVEFHHEKFDGSGYMKGLRGNRIPLNARLFAIVDVFDALTSRRPYKEPLSFDDATAIMHRGRGSHFDPRLLDAFDTVAPKLFAEIDNAKDAVVEAILRRLVNKYFLSSEDLPRRQGLGAG